MIKTKCAVCGLANYRILYKENFSLKDLNENTFSARRVPEKIHFRFVKCRNCGLVYSNPIIEADKLARLYQESKHTYQEQEEDLRQTYGFYLRKAVLKLKKKNNFLDIGCGDGFMLEIAKESGFKNVFGVEPSIDAINKAPGNIRGNIKNDLFRNGLFPENFFDLVTIYQTLDHIPDPNLFLKTVYEVLDDGGRVLTYNHNVNSWSAKILGEKSPIFDIEHTFLYDKSTVRELFEKNGFKVKWVGSTFNIYPISYWLRMLPLPSFVKKKLLATTAFLGVKNFRPKLYAGNLGLIASK